MQRKRALVGVDTSCCPCPWARERKSESVSERVIVGDSMCVCLCVCACVNKTQMSLYCLQNHWGRHDFDLAPRNWFMTHFPPLLCHSSFPYPSPLNYSFTTFTTFCVCMCLCCHFGHKRLKQLRILLECFLIVLKVFSSCLFPSVSLSLAVFLALNLWM